jgi:hypothetical protein
MIKLMGMEWVKFIPIMAKSGAVKFRVIHFAHSGAQGTRLEAKGKR